MTSLRSFTLEEVAKHNKEGDAWVVISGNVYDVSEYMKVHPGGRSILLRNAGTDCTTTFLPLHASYILGNHQDLLIGKVVTAPARPPPEGPTGSQSLATASFGASDIEYAEPYWYKRSLSSPFYNAHHRAFRAKVRSFVDAEMVPFVRAWEEQGTYPPELHEKAYKAGIYAAMWPAQFGGTPPEGGWDAFMDIILQDEMARCGAGGVLASCFFSANIALPPILKVGTREMKDTVARDVITGKKILALAVTEPHAGSDVANLQTTATKDGDVYVVNGEKKFITSGVKADWFTAAVRTGGARHGGVSLLLIDSKSPGVTVRRLPTQGWWTSNTAFISFDNVRVPAKNLIGRENEGFRHVMVNFNHERWAIAIMSNRYARMTFHEAVKYAQVRRTFGKRLIDHQVIRHKLADMAKRIEATHAWIEQIGYEYNNNVSDGQLAGRIALLKVQSTETMEFCAREASQIIGGNSYLRTGPGQIVERIYREVRVAAIGGGSEEIMKDLAMRQAKL